MSEPPAARYSGHFAALTCEPGRSIQDSHQIPHKLATLQVLATPALVADIGICEAYLKVKI